MKYGIRDLFQRRLTKLLIPIVIAENKNEPSGMDGRKYGIFPHLFVEWFCLLTVNPSMRFMPMMEELIGAIAVGLCLSLMAKASAKETAIKISDDAYVLHYARGLKVFGIALPLLLLILFTYAILFLPREEGDGWVVFLAFLIPIVSWVYFYLEFHKVKIVVDNQGISAFTPWLGYRQYLWNEIDQIIYSDNNGFFKVLARNKRSLRVCTLLSGIDIFQEMALKHMPLEKLKSD